MNLYPHHPVSLFWFLLKNPEWKQFLKYSVGINSQISIVYFFRSSQHLLFGLSLPVFLGRLKKLLNISILWMEELRCQKKSHSKSVAEVQWKLKTGVPISLVFVHSTLLHISSKYIRSTLSKRFFLIDKA